MKQSYQKTMYACFLGYIVQAIVNNFVPLLFLTFQSTYQLPLSSITLLVTVNFAVQLLVDLLSAKWVDRVGYRTAVVFAHGCACGGLVLLTVLPEWFPSAFAGLLVSVVLYAVGGGLIEVLISPIVQACPTENKQKAMSLLHSFYCWGHVGVVLVSTAFFSLFGTGNWKVLALLWALLPLANALLFAKVPLYSLHQEGERGLTLRELTRQKIFWLLLLLMMCAGASEQTVGQWASTLAESGLGVGKTAGDLLGPMAFAFLMGATRAFYGKYGDRINLDRFMQVSAMLCLASYLCISLSPWPALGLVGCALCGVSVGILWPGVLSKAPACIRSGGTAMFALLALAGDVGCAGGPTLAGLVSSGAGGDLRTGILAAVVFPALLLVGLLCARRNSSQP